MAFQQHIRILRAQLLDLSRVTQRAVDYSIKGYELGNLDFSCHSLCTRGEIEEHHRRIKELCRQVITDGMSRSSDFRFVGAALSMSNSLRAINASTAEIVENTTRLLAGTRVKEHAALERLGRFVNASMRLCIVALFNEDARLAETVLRRDEARRLCRQTRGDFFNHMDHQSASCCLFERAASRSLCEIAKQIHEIADAILFWLRGENHRPGYSIATIEDEVRLMDMQPARRKSQQIEASVHLHIRDQAKQKPVGHS